MSYLNLAYYIDGPSSTPLNFHGSLSFFAAKSSQWKFTSVQQLNRDRKRLSKRDHCVY